ncbi:FMN-binding protein [Jidongwangia harbinensis]|uniref:FMN-binding protein n=1 Tax=Jidongwangia harbinensis TaxID=2878561 RepID=UPI001CDA24E5|nr:FMN-binding protein [Jidongwangia harbinensis]MCA2216534.1 FMN-binding protein [Jidongwangia harbinensis]
MRRSTAAAVGTLTGAALIVGVRLSVSAPDVTAAPPAVDLAGKGGAADSSPSKKPTKKPADSEESEDEAGDSGLQDGTFRGAGAKNPYGTIQVSIKVTGGKIVAADASYPTTNDSATINPPAVAKLKEATLEAQSADVDAVSGATFTSESYVKSLQAALDQAGG